MTGTLVDSLRLAILSSEFVPGQRLVEADLCDRFSASRRAIRDALMRLDQEGLVERKSNVGARVRNISVDEAIENAEVRLLVETFCVARAAQNINAEAAERLRDCAEALSRAAEVGDVTRYSKASAELIDIYIMLSGHAVARDTLERLRMLNARHGFRVTSGAGWLKDALPRRLELIDAICRGDSEAAVAALRIHAEAVMAAMRRLGNGKGRRAD